MIHSVSVKEIFLFLGSFKKLLILFKSPIYLFQAICNFSVAVIFGSVVSVLSDGPAPVNFFHVVDTALLAGIITFPYLASLLSRLCFLITSLDILILLSCIDLIKSLNFLSGIIKCLLPRLVITVLQSGSLKIWLIVVKSSIYSFHNVFNSSSVFFFF